MKCSIHMALASAVIGNLVFITACTEEYPAYRQPQPSYNYYAPPPPANPPAPAPAYASPQPVYAQAAPTQVVYYQLDASQIDPLTGPVALYPDPILAQLLPASTYPQEVMAAVQWLHAVGQPTEQDINVQPWEPSIKAMLHYPTVLQMMNDRIDWTQALGAAFTNQPQDVMASIQRLRSQALNTGALTSNQQQQVVVEPDGVIRILPAAPQVVYVPQYDPQIVYVHQATPVFITFGLGFAIGNWMDNDCDWHSHHVIVGPRWDRGWSRHDGYVRFNEVRQTNITNVTNVTNVTNNTTIINNSNRTVTVQTWNHNVTKPQPVLPASVARQAQARGAQPRVIQQPLVQHPVTQPPPVLQTPRNDHHVGAPVAPAVPPQPLQPPPGNTGTTPHGDQKHVDKHTPPAHVDSPPPAPAPPPPPANTAGTPSHGDVQHSDKHVPPAPPAPPPPPPAKSSSDASHSDAKHPDKPAPPKHVDPTPAPTPPPPPPPPPAKTPPPPPPADHGSHGGDTHGPETQPGAQGKH
jgi:hypothetical protein